MNFGSPEWFFLLPALVVLAWRRRELRLREPLRALILLLLIFVLADPSIKIGGNGLDLWVLSDCSDSATLSIGTQNRETGEILERTKRPDDRVFFVDYAVDAVRRDQGDPVFRGTHLTRTGNALELALAQMDKARASRLLVLSDGYATEPLAAAEKVLRQGVPLDYRLSSEALEADYRVESLQAPARVLPGEAFLVEFAIKGQGNGTVPWQVVRDGKMAASGTAELKNGYARVRLTDRLTGGGAVNYGVSINPEKDAHGENNQASQWVEVEGGSRVVLLSNYPDDPLVPLLQAQGFSVALVVDPGELKAQSLTGARLVVINNVPANRIPGGFLDALDFFVREQGGGLLMAGGQNSFGAGGYFSSSVDPLLPVSMELRKEHRKLAAAMVIVMDRSGSMAMSASGGVTKMELADTGAARAVELLGESDAISVIAVDSSPHVVVPLTTIEGNRGEITHAVRRIESTGGGIFVYTGLKAGWEQLQKAQTGTRHMILFADAADSEEPGDFRNLMSEMRSEGATVSVIGLGNRTDSDAAFLEEVARLGGGRIFFNDDANGLPALFAQETVSVARSAFVKDPTGTAGTPGWAEIAARPQQWMSQVDGYNLSYLRDGATASLITTDEYQAPLVASWARGAGRVAAISFPLGGDHSALVRGWSGYGDFIQTLSRWLAGENAPPGFGLRPVVDGETMYLDLYYDESQADSVAGHAPEVVVSEGTPSKSLPGRELVWEKIEPGHFRTSTRLSPGSWLRGVVRIGDVRMPFGPVTGTTSVEWSFDRGRVDELIDLSRKSGGRERLDLASIWDAPRSVERHSLQIPLLITLLILLLAEALLTRMDISLLPRSWRV